MLIALRRRPLVPVLALLMGGCGGEEHLEPGAAGVDYALQGEYLAGDGRLAAQIVALGEGGFRATLLGGGLPGDGGDGRAGESVEGTRVGDRVEFRGAWKGVLGGGELVGEDAAGRPFSLERVVRKSPTEGAPPPADAVVLFDGRPTARLAEGKADERGLLAVPARSRESYGDMLLHLEFQIPFMPDSREQWRGNSGVYIQGRYEVQVLDSFGRPAGDTDCGAVYEAMPPRINMSYPPLQWQTYDIEFRAARFTEDGERVKKARVTVRHNGVVIHDDVAIDGPTGRGDPEGPDPRPLLLQDHWDPVFYRNVWLLPRGSKP